jgi:hypothetical protein
MWGQTQSNRISRNSAIPARNISSTPTPRYPSPPTANFLFNEDGVNGSTTRLNQESNGEGKEAIYDPELATAGPTHRPSTYFFVQRFQEFRNNLCGIIIRNRQSSLADSFPSDFNTFLYGWTGLNGTCCYSDGWRISGRAIPSIFDIRLVTKIAYRRNLYRRQLRPSCLPTHGPAFVHFCSFLLHYHGRLFVPIIWSSRRY